MGGHTIPFSYDAAGNLMNGGRSGGSWVSMTYDALNRPIKRQGSVTSLFTYDAVGNLVTAINPYARINRAYFKNGALRADTLRLSAVHVPDSNFSLHIYGQRFRYDLSGRRVWAQHPTQLVSGVDSMTYAYDSIFGQFRTVRDPFGNQYRFTYDAVGRPNRLTRRAQGADSIYEVISYDIDSRLTMRRVSRSSGLVRQDSLVYDARNKMLAGMYSAGTATFSPLGHLVGSYDGGGWEEFFVDALGNRVTADGGGPQVRYQYQAGTGRLLYTESNATDVDTTFYQYEWDGATGQTIRYHYWFTPWSFVPDYEVRTTVQTYDHERRLIRTLFQLDTAFNNQPPPPGYQACRSEETYRYDALGRRIYARVVRGPNCANKDKASGCRSSVTRTVWDGDQILFEIRVPGDSSYPQIESDAPGGTAHLGVVGYLHAGGIDQPLALWKNGGVVQPHANWRGAFVQGTCGSSGCDGTVWFPGAEASIFGVPPHNPDGPPSWHGSLIESGQDASGLQYRRNRYYDPATGRFTQEDPIGLAGGLNLYGFANGDPVNFTDPFGLWPCPELCGAVAGGGAIALGKVGLGGGTVAAAGGVAVAAAPVVLFAAAAYFFPPHPDAVNIHSSTAIPGFAPDATIATVNVSALQKARSIAATLLGLLSGGGQATTAAPTGSGGPQTPPSAEQPAKRTEPRGEERPPEGSVP